MMTIINYIDRLRGFNRNAKLFLLSTTLNGLGLALFVLLYNLYILSAGFHQDMIGTITAIASMVAVVAAIPVGWAASRLGYKKAQILGIVGSAASVVPPLLWPTAEAFILCEMVWGAAFTMYVIAGSPFITENSTQAERPYLFSLQFVLTMLTTFVACLVGGDLPRLLGSWVGAGAETPVAYQAALWIGTGLLFLSALPLVFLRPAPRHTVHPVRPRFRVRDPRKVTRLVLPGIIGAVGGGMFVPFVTVLWKVAHHLDDAAIGQVMAISGLGMALVGVIAPMVSSRWGLVRVNVTSLVLSSFALAIFGFSPLFTVALVAYLGRDALVNLSRPLTQQFQMERTHVEEHAAVSSIYTMGVNVAWGIGSWVSGRWQTNGWFPLVFGVSIAFYLFSGLLWQWLFGRSSTPHVAGEYERDKKKTDLPVTAGAQAE